MRFGTSVTGSDFRIPADPRFVLNSFGVICFGLVGLELASVMGDEIREPEKNLPGAVAWGGVLSGALYILATLTLAGCGEQERDQRVAGNRAGGQSHGGARGSGLDRGAVCVDAEHIDRGDWFGLAGGIGADTVCCGA